MPGGGATWYASILRDVAALRPGAVRPLERTFAEIARVPAPDPYSVRWCTVIAIVASVLEESRARGSAASRRRLQRFLSENEDLLMLYRCTGQPACSVENDARAVAFHS